MPPEGPYREPTEAGNDTKIQARFDQLLLKVVDREGLKNIPPPTPLVEGWLFKDSLAWIQGKWGNAKSFLAVDIACGVATGTKWHGIAVQQGTVLYLIAEGASGISQRVDAWETANGTIATNLHFLPVPVGLADPEGVDTYAFGMLLNHFKPVLCIIDTQARVTVGAEENSSTDMGKFVDSLEHLRARQATTMLPVHHEPRNGENLRGSVALEGAAMSIIRSSKEGDAVTVSCPKQKDVPEPEDIELTLYPIDNSAVFVEQNPNHQHHTHRDRVEDAADTGGVPRRHGDGNRLQRRL
jgi:RecA-family ATPase